MLLVFSVSCDSDLLNHEWFVKHDQLIGLVFCARSELGGQAIADSVIPRWRGVMMAMVSYKFSTHTQSVRRSGCKGEDWSSTIMC